MSKFSGGISAAESAAGYQTTTRRPSARAKTLDPTGWGPRFAYAGRAAVAAVVGGTDVVDAALSSLDEQAARPATRTTMAREAREAS